MLELLYCVAIVGGQMCAVVPSSLNPNVVDAPGTCGYGYHAVGLPTPVTQKFMAFFGGATASPFQPHGRDCAGATIDPDDPDPDARYMMQEVIREGVSSGYTVVMPAFQNDQSIVDICSGQGTQCEGAVRAEQIFGVNTSPLVAVNYANSMMGRLLDLLAALNIQVRPDELVIGGHSQGAGQAMYLAQREAFSHLCLLSGPSKTLGSPWIETPLKTTSHDAFGHSAEPLHSNHLDSWNFHTISFTTTAAGGLTDRYGNAVGEHRSIVVDPDFSASRIGACYP